MIKLIGRKLLFIFILLPLLNMMGYYYAIVHPYVFTRRGVVQEVEYAPYQEYLQKLLSGDLGMAGRVTVESLVVEPLGRSMELLAVAFLLVLVAGPLLGFLAINPTTERMRPRAAFLISVSKSMPGFLLGGMILAWIVYQTLYSGGSGQTLPLGGYGLDNHLLIPVIVLALRPLLHVIEVSATLLEQIWRQDYMLVARSKGLSWRQEFFNHALPNIRGTVVLTLGQAFRLMVGSLIVVETLVNWSGIGRTFMFALGIRHDGRPPNSYFASPDLVAILAVILGGGLLLTEFIAAVTAALADPRLREEEWGER